MWRMADSARLDSLARPCFYSVMGRLLNRLLEGSHAYRIEREAEGYTLVAEPDCLDEFSDLVREAAATAGVDCLVFPVSEGGHVYSEMLVLPLDGRQQSPPGA